MLNEIAPILAYQARNKDNKQLIQETSYYLYRLQRGQAPSVDFERYGQQIAEKLEKSIQDAVNKRNKKSK